MNLGNIFYFVKWFIGCKFDEIINEVIEVVYSVVKDGNGNVKLDCLV